MYFVHLVVVLTLAMVSSYTKLAHAVYRVLAIAGQEYEVLFATAPAPPEHPQHHWAGHGAGPRRSAQLAGDAGLKLVEATPSMPKSSSSRWAMRSSPATPIDEITAAYYVLRDEVCDLLGERSDTTPNFSKRGTAGRYPAHEEGT